MFILMEKMEAQTWTEQDEFANTTFTVIQSIERFEELLKQYADLYAYYSVAYFPKEEIKTMVSDKNRVISGEKPATTTGLFLTKTIIRSDAPKPQADFLKKLGVEHSPSLLRVDPQKGGLYIVFYSDPNMEAITGGMKKFTNYSTMLRFYKSIF